MLAAYSKSSDGSAALYELMGYWPQPENPSYLASSEFEYVEPLNSLSMDFQTRNTNSSPDDNLSTSMGLSGVQQQQQINASPQPSPQPTQQDFVPTSPAQQNDRPFKCYQCPQSFNRNHDLKRHKRIHLAVKPFPCGHCEKSFSRKDALKVRCLFDLIRGLGAGDS